VLNWNHFLLELVGCITELFTHVGVKKIVIVLGVQKSKCEPLYNAVFNVFGRMSKVHDGFFKSNFKMQIQVLTDSYLHKIVKFITPHSFIFHEE
jgi:hypothetical protein